MACDRGGRSGRRGVRRGICAAVGAADGAPRDVARASGALWCLAALAAAADAAHPGRAGSCTLWAGVDGASSKAVTVLGLASPEIGVFPGGSGPSFWSCSRANDWRRRRAGQIYNAQATKRIRREPNPSKNTQAKQPQRRRRSSSCRTRRSAAKAATSSAMHGAL